MGIRRAIQIISVPLTISGVGDKEFVCHDGLYSIQLPLVGVENAVISGLCMPRVTTDFPLYPLHKVENNRRKECRNIPF